MSLLTTARTPTVQIGSLPRVDLLPPSEVQHREVIARARLWVWLCVGATVVAAVAIGATFALNVAATMRLASEQSRTLQIISGIAALSDVSADISTRSELEAMRQSAMGGDLAWTPVVALVASHLPAGVTITGYTLDAGPVPLPGGKPADATGVSGTVTFTSTAPVDFVAATREVRTAAGIRSAEVGDFTSAQGVFTYTVRVVLDQSVYTGAFAPSTEAAK
ncbi:hypothetical protein [Microbacterium sp. CJ88]|uniref:hypothetical protein n=1 Tax=Microbacterium sp. CJ88 TaxID=3445672 RepID=UPI003F6557B4